MPIIVVVPVVTIDIQPVAVDVSVGVQTNNRAM